MSKKTFEQRRRHRIQAYGITVEQYNQMLEDQGGGCYLCGGTDSKSLSIDHCHHTGRVRGLLCSAHNRALGLLGDDPEMLLKAHAYLVKHYV